MGQPLTTRLGATSLISTDLLYLARSPFGLTDDRKITVNDMFTTLTVGASYAGIVTAPTNGMLVQGKLGVGLTAVDSNLDIHANATIGCPSFRVRRQVDGNYTTMALTSDADSYLVLTNGSGNRGIYFNTYTGAGNNNVVFIGSDGTAVSDFGKLNIMDGANLIVDAGGGIGLGVAPLDNQLDILGAMAIGNLFAASLAPTNGAMIEGKLVVGQTAHLGAYVHINQNSTTAGEPVLNLTQADIDDSFVDFQGQVANDSSRSLSNSTTTTGNKTGAIRIETNGSTHWIRIYDSAT